VGHGPGGWGRATQMGQKSWAAVHTMAMGNREKTVGDMSWPTHSGQDGANKDWATPQKTRALAQGPIPPHAGFPILGKLPKGPAFQP